MSTTPGTSADLVQVSNIVSSVARFEDAALVREADYGIFFMPELAFSFAVGRAINHLRFSVFGHTNVKWQREITLDGSGGPCDLYFKNEAGKGLAIEFKMIANKYKYAADIQKLRRLDEAAYDRLFCALIDAWDDNSHEDERVGHVDSHAGATTQIHMDAFPTWNHLRTERNMFCIVGIWQVSGQLES